MRGKDRLRQNIEAALELGRAGQVSKAEAMLSRMAADPEADELGPRTALDLPRQLHSARLKLAKLGGDLAAISGLRATAVPPPGLLRDLFPTTDQMRSAMIEAAGRKVPQVLHQIWIGDRTPRSCAAWRDWAGRHGWDYRLWDETALTQLDLGNDPAWRAMRELGDLPGAVDVARYHVLLREGGLYLDCDWYPVRPDLGPDALFPQMGLSVLAEPGPRLVGQGSILLGNALIATPPDHPALRQLLLALPKIAKRLPGGPAWWLTGPLPFTLALRNGPVAVLDAAFVAGSLPRGAALSEVSKAVELARNGAGILLQWKDW